MHQEGKPFVVGRRIAVWGATGSGKTTFARRLGAMLGLHVVELDAIRHDRGWDSTPDDEFRERLTRRLDEHPEGWVTDGSYSAISDVYLSRADSLIWLHLPWPVSFARLFRRTVARAWTRASFYHAAGPTESWRMTFLSRRSILWWSIGHHRTYLRNVRERIAALRPEVAVYELRSSGEVEAFLLAAARQAPNAGKAAAEGSEL